MNKKHQSKLEDIENEVDSFKKKRGRPVGSKNKKHQIPSLVKIMSDDEIDKMLNSKKALEKEKKFLDDYYRDPETGEHVADSEATVEQVKDWSRYNHDWQEGFDKGTVTGYESAQSDMKLANKITLVLTAVNVAILISLVIKN